MGSEEGVGKEIGGVYAQHSKKWKIQATKKVEGWIAMGTCREERSTMWEGGDENESTKDWK